MINGIAFSSAFFPFCFVGLELDLGFGRWHGQAWPRVRCSLPSSAIFTFWSCSLSLLQLSPPKKGCYYKQSTEWWWLRLGWGGVGVTPRQQPRSPHSARPPSSAAPPPRRPCLYWGWGDGGGGGGGLMVRVMVRSASGCGHERSRRRGRGKKGSGRLKKTTPDRPKRTHARGRTRTHAPLGQSASFSLRKAARLSLGVSSTSSRSKFSSLGSASSSSAPYSSTSCVMNHCSTCGFGGVGVG